MMMMMMIILTIAAGEFITVGIPASYRCRLCVSPALSDLLRLGCKHVRSDRTIPGPSRLGLNVAHCWVQSQIMEL